MENYSHVKENMFHMVIIIYFKMGLLKETFEMYSPFTRQVSWETYTMSILGII